MPEFCSSIAPQFYPPENIPDAPVLPAIISPALSFSEGLAAVQVGEKAGFIDGEGNFVIPRRLKPLLDKGCEKMILYLIKIVKK